MEFPDWVQVKEKNTIAGSNPAGQLLIYFHNVFPVLTKTLFRHSSLVQVPRQSLRAQTAALLTPASAPPPPPPDQSFTENKAVIFVKTVQICCSISQPTFHTSKNPSVTRCSLLCRLMNFSLNLKILQYVQIFIF